MLSEKAGGAEQEKLPCHPRGGEKSVLIRSNGGRSALERGKRDVQPD